MRSHGFTAWFTGLSSSGKSTVSGLVRAELEARGVLVEHLDGDAVRTHLCRDLGFSKDDRDTNVARIGWVASRLTRAGAAVLVSAISPYAQARAAARQMVLEHGAFVEVFVDAPVEVCARRDVKGLYRRAFAGEITSFTGVDDPYEPPAAPDVHLLTDGETPAESAARVVAELERRSLVPAR